MGKELTAPLAWDCTYLYVTTSPTTLQRKDVIEIAITV
jgi:hypothetical protein